MFPEHRAIAAEGLLPEAIAKNRGPLALRGLFFARQEKPPGGWRDAENVEEIFGDELNVDAFRGTSSGPENSFGNSGAR